MLPFLSTGRRFSRAAQGARERSQLNTCMLGDSVQGSDSMEEPRANDANGYPIGSHHGLHAGRTGEQRVVPGC